MFRTRFLTAAFLVLVLIGVVMISYEAPVLFFLVGGLIVVLGMREFLRMSDGIRGVGIIGGLLVFSAAFVAAVGARPGALIPRFAFPIDPEWMNAALFLAVLLVFVFQITRKDGTAALSRISTTVAGIVYVAWLFSFLVRINYYRFDRFPDYDGRFYLFFLFLVVKVNDSAAYLIGSRYGAHKLLPRISPKKTVEGAVAGVVAGGAAAVIGKFAFGLSRMSWPAALTLGLVLGSAAVLGDLAESLLKRDREIKDSGTTLPGLGGILDLMDSIFITAPMLYLYMKLVLKL